MPELFKSTKETYRIELLRKMLGTVPKNKEVYSSYIATKVDKCKKEPAPDADEEIDTIEEIEEKGWTGFHEDSNGLFIYSYMILGFFKNACQVAMENKAIGKIKAYKTWFDKMVFIYPRRIYFGKDQPDGDLQRPLMVMTPKGPRVTVTRSDYIAEGTQIQFEVEIFNNSKDIDHELISNLLQYGEYQGLGQWRGSGRYGQFKVL